MSHNTTAAAALHRNGMTKSRYAKQFVGGISGIVLQAKHRKKRRPGASRTGSRNASPKPQRAKWAAHMNAKRVMRAMEYRLLGAQGKGYCNPAGVDNMRTISAKCPDMQATHVVIPAIAPQPGRVETQGTRTATWNQTVGLWKLHRGGEKGPTHRNGTAM